MKLPYERTVKTSAPSFTKNFLQEHSHPVVNKIAKAREINKARTTFLDTILRYEHRGRIHADINQIRSDNGKDGIGPNVNIKHSNGKEENRLKSNSYPIKKGTVVTTYTGGGGGFGDSYDRNPKNVLEDVINGLVSIDKAEKDYKVIISRNMSIDYSKTNDLRSKNS